MHYLISDVISHALAMCDIHLWSVLRWMETVCSTFQDLQLDGSLEPHLYRLMPKSWYQQTAQSSVNKLLSILWHNRLP